MRGVHSVVDDIRRNVFTEVARLAYEGGDYKQADMIPYKLVNGEVAEHRSDIFLERAVVAARVRLAFGLEFNPKGGQAPLSCLAISTICIAFNRLKKYGVPKTSFAMAAPVFAWSSFSAPFSSSSSSIL